MRKDKKTKNKIIEVPILNNEYKVVVCFGSSNYVAKALKRYNFYPNDPLPSWDHDCGKCYSNPECHPLIAMPRLPQLPDEFGTLAHEAVHAIEHIFRFLGQEMCGEIFAHSVGAIVRETMKAAKSR